METMGNRGDLKIPLKFKKEIGGQVQEGLPILAVKPRLDLVRRDWRIND